MKLLTNWGLTKTGWRQGKRGEYWAIAQAFLMVTFAVLPTYPISIELPTPWRYLLWVLALTFGLVAGFFLLKGVLDLGGSLTPLPYPRDDGQLIQTGTYGIVRHPIYSGVLFAALAWATLFASAVHLVGAIAFFFFFNAKARREERWLTEKYPDYCDYQQRVKRLIPWVY